MSLKAQDTIPVLRRLWPGEALLMRDHLLRLDPHSRRNRFGSAVSDAFIIHYADRLFRSGATIIGGFLDGDLRGAGELYPLSEMMARERRVWREAVQRSGAKAD